MGLNNKLDNFFGIAGILAVGQGCNLIRTDKTSRIQFIKDFQRVDYIDKIYSSAEWGKPKIVNKKPRGLSKSYLNQNISREMKGVVAGIVSGSRKTKIYSLDESILMGVFNDGVYSFSGYKVVVEPYCVKNKDDMYLRGVLTFLHSGNKLHPGEGNVFTLNFSKIPNDVIRSLKFPAQLKISFYL